MDLRQVNPWNILRSFPEAPGSNSCPGQHCTIDHQREQKWLASAVFSPFAHEEEPCGSSNCWAIAEKWPREERGEKAEGLINPTQTLASGPTQSTFAHSFTISCHSFLSAQPVGPH